MRPIPATVPLDFYSITPVPNIVSRAANHSDFIIRILILWAIFRSSDHLQQYTELLHQGKFSHKYMFLLQIAGKSIQN